jgi:hypothetical protein
MAQQRDPGNAQSRSRVRSTDDRSARTSRRLHAELFHKMRVDVRRQDARIPPHGDLSRHGQEPLKLLTPVRAARCVRLGRSDQAFSAFLVQCVRHVRGGRWVWCPFCVQVEVCRDARDRVEIPSEVIDPAAVPRPRPAPRRRITSSPSTSSRSTRHSPSCRAKAHGHPARLATQPCCAWPRGSR